MRPMDNLFTQFEDNILAIQNDLLQNFSLLGSTLQPVDGLKLDWWSEAGPVEEDVSAIFTSFQSQLNAHVPAASEASEVESALRESLARSMQSAFAHLADSRDRTPRTCYSLGDLYKVSKTSRTEMQRRLDDFYISCKRRRVENQHVMLDEMERSLGKTREKVVKHCIKHSDSSGHSSKTRLRRLALPQRTKVPSDIHGMMDGVLYELETFLTEASAKKAKSPPASPVSAKASRGLEAALNSFFIDVSSGKTSAAAIRDEFSTSTDEVQEAYYSCQFPILDFPPDLLPTSNGPAVPGQRSEDEEEDEEGRGPGGGEDRPGSDRPPSPPSSADDDLLSDMEVIEELDNLPGDSDSAQEGREADEAKEVEEKKEEIFIDLSASDDDDDDVEILFETSAAPKTELLEEEATSAPATRNIFDVLCRSARTKPADLRRSPNPYPPPAAIRNEMDAAEVAAAVSSILPAVSMPSEPAEPVEPAEPAPPPPCPSVTVAVGERSQESLLQQLISVLDRMVALYEAEEGGARMPPARLESMLKESFSVVLGNRVRAGVPLEEGEVAALSLPSWTASIDRTCADFQSHVSAALSSFLMSPASEPPPPASVASDRVSGWDVVISGDAAPALGEEFCVRLDGLDHTAGEKEEEGNTSVVTDSEAVCLAVERVETEAAGASTIADESPAEESQSTASPLFPLGVDADPPVERKDLPGDSCLHMKLMEDEELLEELFGSPAPEETVAACAVPSDGREAGLWTDHFVFLFRCQENPAAREVESLLNRAGASFFDPYHPHLVPSGSRLSVLIHASDADRTHHIPNLLQLKNVRRIRFLLYTDSVSCSLDRGSVLFPPTAFCVVLDADTVATAHPDNLNSLINFLREECQMNRPCRLVLHAQLRQLLADMRSRADRYELYRMDRMVQLLTAPCHEGLIEWTGDPSLRVRPDALLFMLKVQRDRQQVFRNFFLLSHLNPQSKRALMFSRSGIATMSLHEFIVNYTTQPYNEQSPRPYLPAESCAEMMQEDAPLSWCIDILPAYSSSVA